MTKHIIIAGSGFAGTWSALSAARAVALAGKESAIEITVISPEPSLHIRPRLYEAVIENMDPDVGKLFAAVGVKHVAGVIQNIHSDWRQVEVQLSNGERQKLSYDKFVLATGSKLFQPPVPGLREHAFNVDQLANAMVLDQHLKALPKRAASVARNTVVVAGGGFTGIETVAEMPHRLREIFGADADIRVIVVEQAPEIGPDLGPGPRPFIEEALAEQGVEIITGTGVASITADSVTLGNGEVIATNTVVWTAGARANALAAQIPGDHDRFGRVDADPYLHAKQAKDIFVTGDVALAATDNVGNNAAMSCQHALSLGRVAGHNAAAELVGLKLHPYSQPKYVTCLDLGPWGAIFSEGWDRQVKFTRDEGKAIKREINTKWIYPPMPDRDAVFAVANPDYVIVP